MKREIIRLDVCESTNDEAHRLAEKGAAAGTAVVARVQTAGRGRKGRSWVSPEGALLVSVVVRPRAPPDRWGLLPLAAGIAVARGLERQRVTCALRWPNDVFVDEKKVGGVLVEAVPPQFAVVGIGVNVDVPAELLPPIGATLAGRGVDRERLLADVMRELDGLLAALDDERTSDVLTEYRHRCATLGRRIRIGDETDATAIDVRGDGALLVRTRDGRTDAVLADDVHFAGGSEK